MFNLKRLSRVLTAVCGLLSARITVKRRRYFSELRPVLSPIKNNAEIPNELEMVQILRTAEKFCFGRVACLERSIYLKKYLRKRGIPANIVIGVKKYPFRAHAWIEINGQKFCDYGAESIVNELKRIED